jgi:hypothetical protein
LPGAEGGWRGEGAQPRSRTAASRGSDHVVPPAAVSVGEGSGRVKAAENPDLCRPLMSNSATQSAGRGATGTGAPAVGVSCSSPRTAARTASS